MFFAEESFHQKNKSDEREEQKKNQFQSRNNLIIRRARTITLKLSKEDETSLRGMKRKLKSLGEWEIMEVHRRIISLWL